MATNPTLLSMPLAQNGQKNMIPATQATAGDGLFSQSTGFPSETSLPLGAGGVAPSREDFNGMANLLGGVAFYAQKGFTFNYDATQDYYAGCIVIDTSDGLRYECIADMTAGTIAPHDDTTNTYWKISNYGMSREQIPAFNHRDVITTSGTYTAPVDGWYKITVKGAGGGGAAFQHSSQGGDNFGGGGGGEGGTTVAFEFMTAGATASVVIGGGGAGGTYNTHTAGYAGGNSSVAVNSNTYTGGGGEGGNVSGICGGGIGGVGTISGSGGGSGQYSVRYSSTGGAAIGGTGGGNGGGTSHYQSDGTNAETNSGAGGGGGSGTYGAANFNGGNGADGFAWFEYFAAI